MYDPVCVSTDYRKAELRDWAPGQPTPPDKYHERTVRRFWSKVDKSPGLGPNGDCWEWIPAQGRNTYGCFAVYANGKLRMFRPHAAAWSLMYGHDPAPKGYHLCHECNNKPCVREEHLWVGTPLQNVRHAQRTGLVPRAKRPPREHLSWFVDPLTPKQAEMLREGRRSQGFAFDWLARSLEIHFTHLHRLEIGERGIKLDKLLCLLGMLGINREAFDLQSCSFRLRNSRPRRRVPKYRVQQSKRPLTVGRRSPRFFSK